MSHVPHVNVDDLLDIWEGVERSFPRSTAPTEIDDGPPRERCTFCGGDPMGFTACCPATADSDDLDAGTVCMEIEE